uniref:RRM domain-containing protein n=1 Tax=Bursaphelenchus xylophilus TaxID=6326 RepID=A0A1I7RSP8_BURXY
MEQRCIRFRENLAQRLYEPHKIYFTHHPPNATVGDVAKLFSSRFRVQDISLHEGFGYVYVNDPDAGRKVNVYNNQIFYKGRPLLLAESLAYKPSTGSISEVPSVPCKHSVEKSVETEVIPAALVDQISKVDWMSMDLLELKEHGKSLQFTLQTIQSIYKRKLVGAEDIMRVSQIPLPPCQTVPNDENIVEKIQIAPLRLEHKNVLKPSTPVLGDALNTPENVNQKLRRRVMKYDPINLKHVQLLKHRLELLSPIGGNENSYPVCTSTPQHVSFVNH